MGMFDRRWHSQLKAHLSVKGQHHPTASPAPHNPQHHVPISQPLGVLASTLLLSLGTCMGAAQAQIHPDGTVNTIVTPQHSTFTITGGTSSGANLFHSFSEFSVPTGTQAVFNNAHTISNIFSRVTGGTRSHIDGLIRANGTANLYLLNPSGIIFGENAALNLGGSFFASTAHRLVFENTLSFSATDPPTAPLLSLNLPIGLQWGNTARPLQVQGSTLAVQPGQTLSLSSGPMTLTQATLQAPGGTLNLTASTPNTLLPLGHSTLAPPTALSDIQLHNSQLNVTAEMGGTLTTQSHNLILNHSALDAGLTPGGPNASATSGHIVINSLGNTLLSNQSQITHDLAVGSVGDGGNITLNTTDLALTDGSRIQAITHTTGTTGDILIHAKGAINISGFTDGGQFSGILSQTAAEHSGSGGNIIIHNPQNSLTLTHRGFIASVTNSTHPGGAIELNLNTLTLQSGGQIITATTHLGPAGDITINAAESVSIVGQSSDFLPNPFLELAVFDLDLLDFVTDLDPNIAESDTIPHISVERTPTQIVSGTTVLGSATAQVDYYTFSVTEGNSRAIVDIDGGFTGGPGSLDTFLVLFNRSTADIVQSNDDAFTSAGAGGSVPIFELFSTDSFLDTVLTDAGEYVIGVGTFPAEVASNQLVRGSTPQVGDTYILQVSLENQGTDGIALPMPIDTTALNPNIEANSALLSHATGGGHGGQLLINTPQITLENKSQISSSTLNGRGGDIVINASHQLDLNNETEIHAFANGSGNGGHLRIDSPIINILGGSIFSLNRSTGDNGNILIGASESLRLDAGGDIFNSVGSGAQGNGGDLTIETSTLRLLNGAQIATGSNRFLGDNANGMGGHSGDINIRANAIDIIGFSSTQLAPSAILSRTESGGNAGNITVMTDQLRVVDGATIDSLTSGSGAGGNISILASDFVEVLGANDFEARSLIASNAVAILGIPIEEVTGNAGDLDIVTGQLRLLAGGEIRASTHSSGNAGNVRIQAEHIEISDVVTGMFTDLTSGIFVGVEGSSTGQGGGLVVEAGQLNIHSGGQITAATLGAGNAGSLLLNVDALNIDGLSEDGRFPSRISAFSMTDFAAGSIEINARQVQVSHGAEISVNANNGAAGNIDIDASQDVALMGGQITAATARGDGGNLTLDVGGQLRLRQESLISATAGQTGAGGDGGNIRINAPLIVSTLPGNSDITANAFAGDGGNIQINTEGLFGIAFQSIPTAASDITASSRFGVDGVVTIETPGVEPQQGLVNLPTALADVSNQIAQSCQTTTGQNSLVAIGRAGLPAHPQHPLRSQPIWQDQRLWMGHQVHAPTLPGGVGTTRNGPLMEAQGWERNAQGRIRFVAHAGTEQSATEQSATEQSATLPCLNH